MAMLSSPCAAMQPPPPRPSAWAFGRDISEQLPRLGSNGSFGRSSGFNFKDLSMSRSQSQENFGGKLAPLRGSSPTASLAADLSQNFYIDQSPKVPTPRRSLFTSGVFTNGVHEGATTPPYRWEGVTTPPIPSSSPCYGPDSMDISPLPHKLPFSFAQKQDSRFQSPSRYTATNENLRPAYQPAKNPLMELRGPVLERRKSNLNRPSLSRTKCLSATIIAPRVKENELPQFTFGAGNKGLTNGSSNTNISLDECFMESPPQEKNPFGNVLPNAPRPRLLFSSTNAPTRGNASPSHGVTRRSVGLARPRKQFRRTLSMFEHPGDVMKAEKDREECARPCLDSIMDVDEGHQLHLPNFVPEDKPDSLPRVNQETMNAVLDGEYKSHYDQVLVIDCRFEYEYNGGHINGAQNFNDKEQLCRQLFDPASINAKTLIVLHCEYSAHRAPLMAQHIRQQDRSYNIAHYPKLTYPELYILDGGYSSFFTNHRLRCYPQNYVEMDAKEHERACERGLNKIRQRTKLSRARTFAFGQQMDQPDSSPSTMFRSDTTFQMDLGYNRMHARRMASY